VQRNRVILGEAREVWRRSGGRTRRVDEAAVAAWYRERIAHVRDVPSLRHEKLAMRGDEWTTPEERAAVAGLPVTTVVRDRDVGIEYDVEEGDDAGPVGVARLRLPEKLARSLVEEELPVLDRPLRFVVPRGQRGAARGDTLAALQEALEAPYTDEELDALGARYGRRREGREWQREQWQQGKQRKAVIPPKRRGRKGR
jgi:hypothetical protein